MLTSDIILTLSHDSSAKILDLRLLKIRAHFTQMHVLPIYSADILRS